MIVKEKPALLYAFSDSTNESCKSSEFSPKLEPFLTNYTKLLYLTYHLSRCARKTATLGDYITRERSICVSACSPLKLLYVYTESNQTKDYLWLQLSVFNTSLIPHFYHFL